MKKKIAVVMTVLLLLAGCFSMLPESASYAEAGDAAALLSAMGIISAESAGGANLNMTMTRAEFAKMLVMASPYKDLVAQSARSSVYKDVPYTHWAAPYIKLAASNGIISGYSDGTFRPDGNITYEQAIYGALTLLGYSKEDFTGGVYPYPQISLGISIGLSAGVSGGAGGTLTKQDGIELIYNLLNCDVEDGTMKYAESIGYEINDNGQIDYAAALSSNMNGPVTVRSTGWYSGLGLSSEVKIYKNGSLSSLNEVEIYDVAYYSTSSDTAWVYSDRVSGIYEKAEPNQDVPSSIILSGDAYEIGSTAAFSALSSVGSLKPGNSVTLLLDKDGNIADAVSANELSSETVIYVTETGTKVYENSDGNNYTSFYISGTTADGTEREYAASSATWVDVGDIVRIGVDDNGLKVSSVNSGSNVRGEVDPALMQIGSSRLADNVAILDTFKGSCATVSPQRLSGLTLSSDKVLYYSAKNGEIKEMILDNVSGDAADYGVVVYAKSSSSGMSSSGTYTYMVEGISTTISTSGMSYNVSKGAAMFYDRGDGRIGMNNISCLSSYKAVSLSKTSIIASGKTWLFADDVTIYRESGTSYITSNVDEAISAKSAGKTVRFYYDKLPEYGGRIRVIVIGA